MWAWANSTIWMIILTTVFLEKVVQGKKIFCYYSSFAQTRHGLGNFLPENINPHLCTHLIYAFADISPDGRDLIPFNRNDQGPTGLYARTLALKEQNPSLKVLLAVGGWQIGSKPFIPMIRDESNMRTWTRNVVNYLRRHKFDGFDVDWEFPATRGSAPQDKYRFTLMMKGLYEAFAEEAAETGQEKLLLTLATASGTFYINQSYEPEEIIKYVDFMLLMTYNYHGQWEKATGHHSGLNRHSDDPTSGEKSQLFQQWSIDYWLQVGIPKEKLIVGIPTYGMSFSLANPADNGLKSPATGGGRMGDYTRETGILAYYEICLNLKDKDWRSVWVEDQVVPYAYSGDQWVGYDNKRSVVTKAENIQSRGLAGAFVWSLEMDDFRGKCGEGTYPLLAAIKDVLHGQQLAKPAARQSTLRPSQPEARPPTVRPPQPEARRPTVRPLQPEARQPTVRPPQPEARQPTVRPPQPEARQPTVRPPQPEAHVLTKSPQKQTRLRLAQSKVPKLPKASISDTKLGHIWSKQVWDKLHRLVEIGRSLITTAPTPVTESPFSGSARASNRKDGHPSPRWSGSRWGRTGWTKPAELSSLARNKYESWQHRTSSRGQSEKILSKGDRHESKMALVLPSSEVHEVKSWQTTRWWTGAAESLGAVPDPEQINARATGRPGMGVHIERTAATTQATTKSPLPKGNPTARTDKEFLLRKDIPQSRLCTILGVGMFADPRSCDHFIICMSGTWRGYPPHIMACPVGTRFDPNLKICNYASEVPCKH